MDVIINAEGLYFEDWSIKVVEETVTKTSCPGSNLLLGRAVPCLACMGSHPILNRSSSIRSAANPTHMKANRKYIEGHSDVNYLHVEVWNINVEPTSKHDDVAARLLPKRRRVHSESRHSALERTLDGNRFINGARI